MIILNKWDGIGIRVTYPKPSSLSSLLVIEDIDIKSELLHFDKNTFIVLL